MNHRPHVFDHAVFDLQLEETDPDGVPVGMPGAEKVFRVALVQSGFQLATSQPRNLEIGMWSKCSISFFMAINNNK